MQEPEPPPRIDAALLREFLADRNAICPGCQYNLRGLTGEKCPECAADLALGLSAASPLGARVRRWIVVFASVIVIGQLVRGGFAVFWIVRYWWGAMGVPGMPRGFLIRECIDAAVTLGTSVAAIVALVMLAFSSARPDSRFRRCLRICVVLAGLYFAWEIIMHILYLITG